MGAILSVFFLSFKAKIFFMQPTVDIVHPFVIGNCFVVWSLVLKVISSFYRESAWVADC